MDVLARHALENWSNHNAPNLTSVADSVASSIDSNDRSLFTAKAHFELPDGGRFSLTLSGSVNATCDALTAMIQDGLCLPDGFLIDINSFIFNQLTDRPPASVVAMVNSILSHASVLFDKLVTDVASKPSDASEPRVAPSPDSTGLKRKRLQSSAITDPEFGVSRLATTTLMKQISLLRDMDTRKDGFTAIPVEDDLYRWNVRLFFDDTDCPMAKDLARLPDYSSILLEFRFPSLYPDVPPVVRVVSPYISGGHVAPHGGICMELLTTSGWAPVNSIDVVCIQIRTMLLHGQARVDPKKIQNIRNYTFEGALRDMRHIVRIHHWDVANTRVSRRRTLSS